MKSCHHYNLEKNINNFSKLKMVLKLCLAFQSHADAYVPLTVHFLATFQIHVYLFVDMTGRSKKKQLITIHGVKVEGVHL